MSANSTVMFSGFNPNSRNSSKVLAPPGGGSSGIFGPPIEEEKPQRRPSKTSDVLNVDEKENEKEKDSTVENQVKPHGLAHTFEPGKKDEEKPASERKAVDPLNGAVLGERGRESPFNPVENNVASAPKSTTRMPPGGHSTPFW